jgi:hypothetical protein
MRGQRGLPARQRRRHWYVDLVLTRSQCATCTRPDILPNICAACSRTFSRRARPTADRPPPSGYLMIPA